VNWGGEKVEGGEIENDNALGCAFVNKDDLVGPSTIALLGNPVD
jgi:hypothetical protein